MSTPSSSLSALAFAPVLFGAACRSFSVYFFSRFSTRLLWYSGASACVSPGVCSSPFSTSLHSSLRRSYWCSRVGLSPPRLADASSGFLLRVVASSSRRVRAFSAWRLSGGFFLAVLWFALLGGGTVFWLWLFHFWWLLVSRCATHGLFRDLHLTSARHDSPFVLQSYVSLLVSFPFNFARTLFFVPPAPLLFSHHTCLMAFINCSPSPRALVAKLYFLHFSPFCSLFRAYSF